jgi:hypothetical protein
MISMRRWRQANAMGAERKKARRLSLERALCLVLLVLVEGQATGVVFMS